LKVPNELWHELRSEITVRHRRFSTFDLGANFRFPPRSRIHFRRIPHALAYPHRKFLPDWAPCPAAQVENGELTRTFSFEDFQAALHFVNRVGNAPKRPANIRTSTSATTKFG